MKILSIISFCLVFVMFYAHIVIDRDFEAPTGQHIVVFALWVLVLMGLIK